MDILELLTKASPEMGLFAGTYLYVFFGWTLSLIAQKTGTDGSWLAWFPVANFWLLIRISGRSSVWFVYLLIPLLNLIALGVLWRDVSGACGKATGVAWLIPTASLSVFFLLASIGQPPITATVTVLLATLTMVQGYVAFGR
jgi:Family of unknown function (DUF5684)